MYSIFILTGDKGDREVVEFPWETSKTPCPWDNVKYARVSIKRGRFHDIQIVRRDRLAKVKKSFDGVTGVLS